MKWDSMLKRRGQERRRKVGMSLARAQLDQAISRDDDTSLIGVDPSAPYAHPPVPFPSTEIGSLAELLDDQHPKRIGGMVCPCCTNPTRRAVRVRPGGARRWVAACAICAGKLLAGHPETLVGGHVRPRAKRAG